MGEEAKREKSSAERQLAQVQANWGLIRSVAATMVNERQANHFAERLRTAFRDEQ